MYESLAGQDVCLVTQCESVCHSTSRLSSSVCAGARLVGRYGGKLLASAGVALRF